MTSVRYSTHELRNAYRASSLGLRMLAQRAEVSQADLVSLLRGKDDARIDVLMAVASHLSLVVKLEPQPQVPRARGAIQTIVDIALDQLHGGYLPARSRD